MAERTLIRPPSSQLGPLGARARDRIIDGSPLAGKYETVQDRKSAYEILAKRAADAAAAAEKAEAEAESKTALEREFTAARRYSGTRVGRSTSAPPRRRRRDGSGGFGEAMAKMVVKELKGTTGRRIVRGILGGLFKGR